MVHPPFIYSAATDQSFQPVAFIPMGKKEEEEEGLKGYASY